MPWFKVDDQLHDHKKARLAGVEAMGLWVLAGSWCGANPDDGFVPEVVVIRWAPRNYRKLADLLVKAQLWHPDVDADGQPGWRFHDWPDYQPTKAEIQAERSAARERMRSKRARDKGVTADVRPNTTRTSEGTSTEVRSAFLDPGPNRTEPQGGRATTAARPDPWCPRHPGGTDQACGACGAARRTADAWQPPTPIPPTVAELRQQGLLPPLRAVSDP